MQNFINYYLLIDINIYFCISKKKNKKHLRKIRYYYYSN